MFGKEIKERITGNKDLANERSDTVNCRLRIMPLYSINERSDTVNCRLKIMPLYSTDKIFV